MGTARWGLERSSKEVFVGLTKGEADGEDEDHMAGLVSQIAQAMLEEDEDDGKPEPETVWGSHSAFQAHDSIWGKSSSEAIASPKNLQNWQNNATTELLYFELVRLKMEELAVAQHQLFMYQNALMNARNPFPFGCTPTDCLAPEPTRLTEQHRLAVDMPRRVAVQAKPGRGEWTSHTLKLQGSKQRLAPPAEYADGGYLARVPSAPRESGGTGVFLPRCRAGSRHLRVMEGKRQLDVQFPAATQYIKSLVPNKRKEDIGKAVKYPTFSVLPEVSPEVSLPTEWTY